MGNALAHFGRIPFRHSVGRFLEKLFDVETGHSHDGVDSRLVATQAILAALGLDIRIGRVQLRGTAKTPVAFQEDTAASLTTTVDGADGIDMSTPGDGGTILINPDGDGEDTATLNAAVGTSVSGASPSTDISAGTDNKFVISVDGDEPEEVALTLDGLNSGAAIAAEMQTKIRALGGNKAAVSVDYNVSNAGKYTVKGVVLGTNGAVVITPALLNNITEELKLGVDAGGTETPGTGDCADITAVTLDELVDLINGDIGLVEATHDGHYITITSKTTGRGSSLVAGNSSLKTVLGLAQGAAAYGAQGLGYESDMADNSYVAMLTIDGTAAASLGDIAVGVTERTAAGFTIECETAADESHVAVLVVGPAA